MIEEASESTPCRRLPRSLVGEQPQPTTGSGLEFSRAFVARQGHTDLQIVAVDFIYLLDRLPLEWAIGRHTVHRFGLFGRIELEGSGTPLAVARGPCVFVACVNQVSLDLVFGN